MKGQRLRAAAARAGDVVLWVTAVLGLVSVLLAVATVVAGVQPLIFRSSSMAPQIQAGALALAKTVPASQVEIGDVVSVDDADGVRVTHRVVEIDEAAGESRSLTLQGDSNRSPDADPYVVSEVDRVFLDVPYVGYVAHWMSSPFAMFLAGIVVALVIAGLWFRPRESRGRDLGAAAAVVAVVGLAAGSLSPPQQTRAYFSDTATFEAGVINAAAVTIFDLDAPSCVQDGQQIKVRYKLASSRFTTIWHRTAVGAPVSGNPIKELDLPGGRDTVVEATFTRADVVGSPAAANGPYELVGRSKLRGGATTPWLSSQERRIGISLDATGVRCGTTNAPPTLVVGSPGDSVTYPSGDAIEAATLAACGRRSPCGTATDLNGITSVEYRLQRANGLGTQCWNPGLSGFYLSGCSTWRDADTSPSVPTTTAASVTWRVPVSLFNNTTFSQAGSYKLYLRITDNASPTKAVTERAVVFTVR